MPHGVTELQDSLESGYSGRVHVSSVPDSVPLSGATTGPTANTTPNFTIMTLNRQSWRIFSDGRPQPGGARERTIVDYADEDALMEPAAGGRIWLRGMTLEEIATYGEILDESPDDSGPETVLMGLAEAILRVRTREGGIARLRPNAAQRAFEQRRGKRNIVLKARQMGFTTWAAARFFLRTITRPGTLTLEVAHTQEAAEEIFRIVHRFYDWLPQELKDGPLAVSQLNVRQIAFPELDSQFRVVTAGDRNAGRGLTVQNLHCSEVARWPGDAAETLAGLRAALAPEAEVILESTPMGACGCFYDEWRRAAETGTVRHFFPWWMEPRYAANAIDPATITEDEQMLAAKEGLSLEQIGFRRQIRTGFQKLARQEYAEDAESCFLASGESIFELGLLDRRFSEMREPAERRRNGDMEVWFPPVRNAQYIVSLDPAGGGSEGDYSAIEVLDLASGLQCAEFAGHVGGLELARLAAEVANEYNHAWLVVERNNIGSGVLAYLETSCRYDRVYRQKGQPGWLTTSISRPAAVNRLAVALVDSPEIFQSRRLLTECRSFVRLADGGVGARAGAHDDRVMAMAIALAARAEMLEEANAGRMRY